jgi:7-carboxy-7-deazaguanine synthase (Cx14CxxC type)
LKRSCTFEGNNFQKILSDKIYSIKEIYYTLQGEGSHTGRPAVFCRFSGCNLWSGREEDRAKAICQFCDTDFWGTDGMNGGKYNATSLAQMIDDLFPQGNVPKFVVCTGGEPLLQLDEQLINAFHLANIEVAVETNGTINTPQGIDWLCMSPKANTEIVINSGDEIKIVFPQQGIDPKDFGGMDFKHFYLQPMDGADLSNNIEACINYCLKNPQWKLSLQTHKMVGLK